MIKLQAKVKRDTGYTRHYLAKIENGSVAKGEEFPSPSSVEIEETEDGFFLLYLDSKGACLTDTWYQALKDAKAHAKLQFGIGEEDWIDLTTQ
jgi:hypothetical protein